MKVTPESSAVKDAIANVTATPEGTASLSTADRQARRLQEQVVLELMEQSYRNYIVAEQYSGDRRGFEIR